MKIILLLLALFSLSLAVSLRKTQDEPPFCNKLDCPHFTVISKRNGYEIRKYEPSKWVGTTIASLDWQEAVKTGFDRLFKYISGENQSKTKVPMAVPVATKIEPGQGPACESNFTILFFVPFSYQGNTPIPTDTNVSIISLPTITVYVSDFGGFESDDDLQKYATQLATDLTRDKLTFTTDPYFTASYDSPYRLVLRHNEVWFLAGN